MNILEELANLSRKRVETDKQKISLQELKESAKNKISDGEKFFDALNRPGLSFICEVKKASPSKGIISKDFPYLKIAKNYQEAGADCISCLTEPYFFLGSNEIFTEIRQNISIPMLRKDFTVDEYQIYQAKVMGADAILLICAILNAEEIEKYLKICDDLKMAALVEAHDETEIKKALSVGAKIIGVNNRNLKDFSVDFTNAAKLREIIPQNVIYVAESGVKSPDDIKILRKIGANAVLIGETLMRAENKHQELEKLKNE